MPEPKREPSPQQAASTATETQTDTKDRQHDADGVASSQSFEPLFTLLTNSTSNTTIHPQVHYLFSDDDPSILTHASAASDASHRTIVVDLAPAPPSDSNQWSVSWASSLSSDFAVTSSQVAVPQAKGDNDADAGALMLRIEGVEREPVEVNADSLPASGSGALGREDVDALSEDFRRRMTVLRKVVGEGEKRREVIARQDEMLHHETAEMERSGSRGHDNGSEQGQEQ